MKAKKRAAKKPISRAQLEKAVYTNIVQVILGSLNRREVLRVLKRLNRLFGVEK